MLEGEGSASWYWLCGMPTMRDEFAIIVFLCKDAIAFHTVHFVAAAIHCPRFEEILDDVFTYSPRCYL